MHICVLGAGVAGVTAAYFLAKDGHAVTLIERLDGAALQASYANGGQLSYSYVAPLAAPSVIAQLPSLLFKPGSALKFLPRLEPAQWKWCLGFLAACTHTRSEQTTRALLRLGYYSRDVLHGLQEEEALSFDYQRNGKLVLYRSHDALAGARRQVGFQAQLGSEQSIVSADEAVAMEPALASMRTKIAGAVHTPSEDAGDCHKFTRALLDIAQARFNVRPMLRCEVHGLRLEGDTVRALATSQGDLEADAFVVATGTASRALLAPLGISLRLYPLGGYSLTVPAGSARESPRISITDLHHKVVYAPMGDRLRVAGMVDIVGLHAGSDGQRAALLKRQAAETFPHAGPFDEAQVWHGQRPATPEGTPLLGRRRFSNLWLNTGHGALGFTLACGTARITSDLIARRDPEIGISEFVEPRD